MLRIFLSIVSYDIWFYISHIILHSPIFYKFHSEHHINEFPSFIDTYTGHPLEGPFQGMGALLPFCVYEYSILDILIILSILNIRGMMRHDDRCSFIIGNHHLLHHRFPTCNFGEAWIDHLCGTSYSQVKLDDM
jgi:lathosterol oxidase